jgi:DNA-binding response OmpR family regulator
MEDSEVKILVVDDEIENLKVVIEYFRDEPYRIMYAPNGEAGYEVAIQEHPDIILMDWAMPVLNGIQTTLKIKSTLNLADIPIVMTTGIMTASEDLKSALEAGAIDYIRKPFDRVELKARVSSTLRLRQSQLEVGQKNAEIERLLTREKELLESELDQKDRELTIQAMNVHERDQFLESLLEQINQTAAQLPTELSGAFADLRKVISSQLKVKNSWEHFVTHFESVHPDFFKRLKEEFPRLTSNDLKLSAYVKIGMGNKEIASLMGVEPSSVKSSLRRLKKKIGMEPEGSIRDYFLAQWG